ncbi:MAG: hypothetical protein HY220_00520 [Candidatus Sungbacteria bacterium]|uniref:UDP-N-acetylglucosamine 2-epimerase domain-containing protein n=1 Tax=Candidatus Sungiibacteriota bacterium TaxID=2750080 RepID=A0A9D6LR82_9BACT|nr:hypothetical protein [Candidatus Sungbacteria bacterium]
MKTLFIALPTQAETKNLMLSDMYPLLARTPDLSVVLFVPQKKVTNYKARFRALNFMVEPIEDLEYDLHPMRQFVRTVSYNSIPTGTIKIRQNKLVYENPSLANKVILPLKRAIWLLGHFRVWRELVRAVDPLFHEDAIWDKYFEKYNPSLVFGTNMIHGTSVALIKAARRRGIPSIGMTKSWDNFTSKTMLRVKPDQLIVNNPYIKGEAMRIGDMPENRVTVVGLPQYDNYLKAEWRLTRDEFFKMFNIDPSKKLITYFMGGVLAIDDPRDHIKMLNHAIERGELPPSIIFVRSHPKYEVDLADLKSWKNVVFHIPGKSIAEIKGDREFDEEDVKLLISTIYWSDVTMNTGSTLTIEAAIYDKPTVLIAFDGYKNKPYYISVRHSMDITHYKYVQETGACWRVNNEKELVEATKKYVENPSIHKAGRKKLFDEQVWKIDGKSGERIGNFLLRHLQ